MRSRGELAEDKPYSGSCSLDFIPPIIESHLRLFLGLQWRDWSMIQMITSVLLTKVIRGGRRAFRRLLTYIIENDSLDQGRISQVICKGISPLSLWGQFDGSRCLLSLVAYHFSWEQPCPFTSVLIKLPSITYSMA